MSMSVPVAANGTDTLPSGTWGFGPISVKWSIQTGSEIDVDVSIVGIDVDRLSGTLTSTAATITDNVSILSLINGTLTFTAKYSSGPATDGLWISGQLKGIGFDTGVLNHRIVPW